VIGRRYLQSAEPDPRDVLGLGVRQSLDPPRLVEAESRRGTGPQNVLVRDVETGRSYVRPFRGLRRVR
jgi:hypothetical protein